MATRTTRSVAAAAPAPAAPLAANDVRAFWVFHRGTPGANNAVGFVAMTESDGQAAIAAGMAQDPLKEDGLSLRYIEGDEPGGYPYVPPTPPVFTANVSVTAIDVSNPALATLSAADVSKLVEINAKSITLSGATGTDAASINKAFAIAIQSSTTIVLQGLDNSGPLDFAGFPLAGVGSSAALP